VTKDRLGQVRRLEGRWVSVALRDGSRIDDCQLVSIGRNQVRSFWLFSNGCDTFVLLDDIVDLWESGGGHSRAA
jgi:hypothetical protein